jgi:uncharacterized protein YkwD
VIRSAHLRLLWRTAGGVALTAAIAVPAAPAAASTGLEQQVLNDINSIRAAHGLSAVSADGGLAAGARSYSHSMAKHRFFGHGSWYQRVRRHAHTSTIGEILGYVQSVSRRNEARVIVRAWLNSAPHRAVILSRSFHRAGVGRGSAHWGGLKTAIYTVDFAAG